MAGRERWGRSAAGALPVACSTGRILLTLRSAAVMEPHTWGLPGGKTERGETPAQTALRELREELSYTGQLVLVPSYVYEETGFTFYNFFALVPDEFEPQLDWENDDARWFERSKLPKKMHFGADALLAATKRQIVEAIEDCAGLLRR